MPNKEQAIKQPTRLPIILSTFVYPGAGQFAQKRWIAGTFFSLLFAILLVLLLTGIFRPLWINLQCALDMAEGKNTEFVPALACSRLVGMMALVLLVYFANVVSAWRGYLRSLSEWRMQRMMATIMDQNGGKS